VIDANEGVQENSKRHGYMLSMLGIKQVVVLVNKMDLVGYNEKIFNEIKKEYSDFLNKIYVEPKEFIPISALDGENICSSPKKLLWFRGSNVLSALDSFEKERSLEEKPFRMPVQSVYKFTGSGDSRRIFAGRIESGSIKVGDMAVFLPSNKRSKIKSIEEFNAVMKEKVSAGKSVGFTLEEQIYVNRGDIMCKEGEISPLISSVFRANIFWMGKEPMQKGKEYKLKLATARIPIKIKEIVSVLDASNLDSSKKEIIERHEVAECIIECQSPIAFDLSNMVEATGRFVIVNNYDIAGGGIITKFVEDSQTEARQQVFLREEKWDHSIISYRERALRYGQLPKLILLTGVSGVDKKSIAKELEKRMFEQGRKVYFLGIGNLLRGLDADIEKEKREEHIRRLGEVSHILMDAGLIVVATASDLTHDELRLLQTINEERDIIIINVGDCKLEGDIINLNISPEDDNETNVTKIMDLMRFKNISFSL